MEHKKIKILYAEDNRTTAQETTEALEECGYEVETTFDGNEAWLAFQNSTPDVVVLDFQMPGKTGLDVFLSIREMNKEIPVLILSSYTELCASALRVGTDDFVRKDGGIEELTARIETAWKRQSHFPAHTQDTTETYLLSGITTFHPGNSLLTVAGQRIPLNSMLSELLTILCQNQNQYIPKSTLCKRLWNNDSFSKIRLLRDYISDLRKLLHKDKSLGIHSLYGKGYSLRKGD